MPVLVGKKRMIMNNLADTVLIIFSVAVVVISAIYLKHKIAIDKKAERGDLMAKSEKMVAQAVSPLVYQAEKGGGTGKEKLIFVVTRIFDILDMAHLPHPSLDYIKGQAEKSVQAMKKTQEVIDGSDSSDGQSVATLEEVVKSEQKK